MRDHTYPATAFHAMALVAAARTALSAARAVAERRAGRDASAQEHPAVARLDVAVLADVLRGLVVRMRLRSTVGAPDAPAAALAQSFENRLLLDDAARALRQTHQKLLSLYPAVAPETVEAVRRLAADASHDAVADAPDLAALGARLADVLDALA